MGCCGCTQQQEDHHKFVLKARAFSKSMKTKEVEAKEIVDFNRDPVRISFEVQWPDSGTSSDPQFLSFFQRKFTGFRNFKEFDSKRIMMASTERICIIGYDRRKDEPFDILNCAIPLERKFLDKKGIPMKEKVILVTPISDSIHNFILVVTRKEISGDENPSTILRILRVSPPLFETNRTTS